MGWGGWGLLQLSFLWHTDSPHYIWVKVNITSNLCCSKGCQFKLMLPSPEKLMQNTFMGVSLLFFTSYFRSLRFNLLIEECYSNFSLFIQYHQCMQDIVKECNKKKQNYIKLLPISGHRSGCRWTKSKWEWGLNRRSTTLIPKMKYFHLRWYNARRNFEKKEKKK